VSIALYRTTDVAHVLAKTRAAVYAECPHRRLLAASSPHEKRMQCAEFPEAKPEPSNRSAVTQLVLASGRRTSGKLRCQAACLEVD
jgi:hypothetical protein